jgi:EmrB/QacA subfamily drug resistance transporter
VSGAGQRGEAAGTVDWAVWKVVMVATIGPFMAQLDSTVVNVSLSTIARVFDSPVATVQWIVSGYLLAMTLMLPLNGWLVDRIGAKRLYVICFSLFTVASVLCGASRSIAELNAARIFQGLIGGILAPMTQMMIARAAGRNMARVMGYTSLPILLAPIVGPVVAGAILARATWSWLFYLNVPVGLLGIVLAVFLLPGESGALQKRPFDFAGFALISPGLVALIYGLQNASHSEGMWLVCGGMVLLAGFLWHSLRKGAVALIDVRVFADRIFSIAAFTQFFANAILYGRQLAVPLYLIAGCGLAASQAGWLVAVTGMGMMCSFPAIGFLSDKFGCRAVAAGGALLALLGTLAFVWMAWQGFSAGWAVVGLFAAGVGQGTISIPAISAAYASIPKARIPVANTALNIAQRLGGPAATTLLAVVVSLAMPRLGIPHPESYLPVFVALAVLHLLAFGAAALLPARIQRAAQA